MGGKSALRGLKEAPLWQGLRAGGAHPYQLSDRDAVPFAGAFGTIFSGRRGIWTEEYHRYSWRMMLRSKQGYGTFIVRDKDTGAKKRSGPVDWLDKRQYRKLYTHPDMILQFAHHLRDTYRQQGKTVEVFADIRMQLNFRSITFHRPCHRSGKSGIFSGTPAGSFLRKQTLSTLNWFLVYNFSPKNNL